MSEAGAKPTSSIRRMGVDVQRRIDEHVRLVDAALSHRDVPAVERRGIELALRQKILEKLTARRRPGSSAGAISGGSTISSDAADIDAVLADLPSPEAFAAAHAPLRVDRRRLSWIAVIGAVWAPMFLLMIVLSQVQIAVELEPGQSAPKWQVVLGYIVPPLGWAAPFATTVIGLIALGQIQRSAGRLYGLSLALFDSLLFPLLLLDWLIFIVFRAVGSALGATAPAYVTLALTSLAPTVLSVLIDYILAAKAWVAVRGGPASPPSPPESSA